MINLFHITSKLKEQGIMGMNARNVSYISTYNQRSLFPLVDDKLKTKIIALKAGANVPDLIGTVNYQFEVKHVHKLLKAHTGFVIKPAQGSGGKGILVVIYNKGDHYIKASGTIISKQDVERHITNTLSGLFSLGGKNDVAIIEELIVFDNEAFLGFNYEGVPDIRVIVFKGYPVMAMMRLSTKASDGKANLHQGAVGVGINIRTGKAERAVQFNRPVKQHPDTQKKLKLLEVPHWEDLLSLAASAYEMTRLGYIGVDIVLDKRKGPMILELNARPGLAIQIANGTGILPRLQKIEKIEDTLSIPLPHIRAQFSMKNFA